MIGILLSDQSFEQDIRELLMAFCPGQKFTHDEGEALREAGLIVRGGRTGSGFWLSAERSVPEAENQDGAGTETGPRRFETVSEGRITVDEDSRFETKNRLKRELYQMMSRLTGKELPWGTLTGIRPTKIALTRLYEGASEQEIHDYMKETYLTSEEKIALSLKFPEANPWVNAADKYAVGNVVYGRVARMTDFGAFVELEPGVDALLHVSQISREHVEKPSDVLSAGQIITARVVDFNEADRKISLSTKALEAPADMYNDGDIADVDIDAVAAQEDAE